MDGIAIKSFSGARRAKRKFDAVLSIEDPNARNRLRFHRDPHPRHLILCFEDVDWDEPDIAVCQAEQVEKALDFARECSDKRLLVHCQAGISRSTAMAYVILADRLGPGQEAEALKKVFQLRRLACPNLWVTELGDQVLGRNGSLVAELEKWIEQDPNLQRFLNLKKTVLQNNRHLFARRGATAFKI